MSYLSSLWRIVWELACMRNDQNALCGTRQQNIEYQEEWSSAWQELLLRDMVAQNEEPAPARVPQGGEVDVETVGPGSKVPASQIPPFTSEKAGSQPHLASTNSTIKRDAAA